MKPSSAFKAAFRVLPQRIFGWVAGEPVFLSMNAMARVLAVAILLGTCVATHSQTPGAGDAGWETLDQRPNPAWLADKKFFQA